jgi:hypothetical protein
VGQAIRSGAASGSAAEREAVPLREIACKQAPTSNRRKIDLTPIPERNLKETSADTRFYP